MGRPCPPPHNCPFAWGICTPSDTVLPWAHLCPQPKLHLYRGSAAYAQLMTEYELNGPPLSPSKLPLCMGDTDPHLIMVPLAHLSLELKGHLSWFSVFCRAHDRDRLTDHATQSVTIGRIYVHNTGIRPNNSYCWKTTYNLYSSMESKKDISIKKHKFNVETRTELFGYTRQS